MMKKRINKHLRINRNIFEMNQNNADSNSLTVQITSWGLYPLQQFLDSNSATPTQANGANNPTPNGSTITTSQVFAITVTQPVQSGR